MNVDCAGVFFDVVLEFKRFLLRGWHGTPRWIGTIINAVFPKDFRIHRDTETVTLGYRSHPQAFWQVSWMLRVFWLSKECRCVGQHHISILFFREFLSCGKHIFKIYVWQDFFSILMKIDIFSIMV